MFHTLAFTKLDTAGASNEDIPGVPDPYAPLNASSHYIVPQDLQLLAGYYQNAGATNARVDIPQYRGLSTPSIQPISANAAPITLPPLAYIPPTQLLIPRLSELAFQASNGGAGGVRGVGLLWVTDGNMNTNVQQVFTVRATAAITAVALNWTFGAIALDQNLPPGQYAVVGLDVIGANLVAARLQFPNPQVMNQMRPGVIARPAVGNYMWPWFRWGNSGLFGTFQSTALPNLEVFASGANTAQTIFMDIARIGNS